MKSVRDYLRDLLTELDDISSFTVDGRDAYLSDTKTQKAIIRSYEVIGIIVKRLPENVREKNPQIDWRRLAGFRDFLAHNYQEVILEFVWNAVEDAPNLRASIAALLQNAESDDD